MQNKRVLYEEKKILRPATPPEINFNMDADISFRLRRMLVKSPFLMQSKLINLSQRKRDYRGTNILGESTSEKCAAMKQNGKRMGMGFRFGALRSVCLIRYG